MSKYLKPKDLYTILFNYLLKMAESVFRGMIEFFGDIGIYDVVLPFLLVFTPFSFSFPRTLQFIFVFSYFTVYQLPVDFVTIPVILVLN